MLAFWMMMCVQGVSAALSAGAHSETVLLQSNLKKGKRATEQIAYSTIVLGSTDFNVSVFTPISAADDSIYYKSTRFDWSSMIGDMYFEGHRFFPSNTWRQPHDPTWTESGVGLASEFGCGDDGSVCRSGWQDHEQVTSNGVLGYDEADIGQPFLKVGVGKLIKGACSAGVQRCNYHDEVYRFNSPYKFAETPQWNVTELESQAIEMTHCASLGERWGYCLQKLISVEGSSVIVKSRLENTGSKSFATPHYSHNFLAVDKKPTGPGWGVGFDLDVSEYVDSAWAVPLSQYFEQVSNTSLRVKEKVPSGVAMKANFGRSTGEKSHGSYSATFDGVQISHTIDGAQLPLYAYNFYVEQTTMSPEPITLISLGPSELASWTHTYSFVKQ
eukprot:TRINITY_DN41203_c0_g1_i1.p1 TRINITY_DN41203_c0_g1~~TRINITY_DN41203_c0_g1_i1.p1  ORF type:complete len:386 (-),score=32.99 TRINITY_DN41203_c0_g1_i1:226-1383(-)